ncbi:hypothetical protein TSUD_186980 [Trifolium subterraneum]|uniref:Subtilisin-like protease fibronectin type-III domain-containing protein n=1 Tax=Trifolium subterraneum TaxID=3900 RepID=A0A2Z6NW56_TRISU|nr:hypothetical protein TSUD_186980 [Trifolium subterraneum]
MSSSGYSMNSVLFSLFLFLLVAKVSFCFSTKVYVVYMGSKSWENPDDILKENHQILASVHSGSIEEAQASHVYSYKHGFRGFAAKLSDEQASQISRIWPESPSFSDTDMPEVPLGWKGRCQSGEAFNASTCNRIISASQAFAGYFTPYQSSYCLESSLNKTKTKGKILVCRHVERSTESKVKKSKIVKEAGGVGMILIDETDQDVAVPFVIPSAIVGKKKGETILSYIKTTRKPMSRILAAKTVIGARPAPRVAAFSSKATILDKRHRPIIVDPEQTRANAFDYGSGFLNPLRVLNPGLIYDSEPTDFITFLCSLGYDQRSLHLVTRDNETCKSKFTTASNLNYPSIAVANLKDNFSVTRIVTNVGKATSIYKSVVSPPPGVNVTVTPNRLVFTRIGQKIKFSVNFKVSSSPSKGYKFGFLSWTNRRLQVTSPLVVKVG